MQPGGWIMDCSAFHQYVSRTSARHAKDFVNQFAFPMSPTQLPEMKSGRNALTQLLKTTQSGVNGVGEVHLASCSPKGEVCLAHCHHLRYWGSMLVPCLQPGTSSIHQSVKLPENIGTAQKLFCGMSTLSCGGCPLCHSHRSQRLGHPFPPDVLQLPIFWMRFPSESQNLCAIFLCHSARRTTTQTNLLFCCSGPCSLSIEVSASHFFFNTNKVYTCCMDTYALGAFHRCVSETSIKIFHLSVQR